MEGDKFREFESKEAFLLFEETLSSQEARQRGRHEKQTRNTVPVAQLALTEKRSAEPSAAAPAPPPAPCRRLILERSRRCSSCAGHAQARVDQQKEEQQGAGRRGGYSVPSGPSKPTRA